MQQRLDVGYWPASSLKTLLLLALTSLRRLYHLAVVQLATLQPVKLAQEAEEIVGSRTARQRRRQP